MGQAAHTIAEYAHPEVLVSTDWVLENLDNPTLRFVEVDVDTTAYDAGHIPGAVGFNWQTQLQDQINRDVISKPDLEQLLGQAGISNDTAIVLYGDNSNWFAAYAFWILKLYGHEDIRLINGGRNKWLNEDDKPLTTDAPAITPTTYTAKEPNPALRAHISEVLKVIGERSHNLIDVRSPDEYTGKVIAPPGMTETAQRGGHIPGAKSVPWSKAVAEDGTFRPLPELKEVYFGGAAVDPARDTIAYCRIGERSSLTWFVLTYLLGFENVRNYDGSWTEWGNRVRSPIETGV